MAKLKNHSKFNFIANSLAHNAEVKIRLEAIEAKLDGASSSEELIESLKNSDSAEIITFKKIIGRLWILLAILLFIASMYVFSLSAPLLGFVLLILAALTYIPWYKDYQMLHKREMLIKRAFTRYEELKYGFTYDGSQPDIDFHENILLFEGVFDRGNYYNDIHRYASGTIQKDGQNVNYTVIHYYFVNRKKVSRGWGKSSYVEITDNCFNVYGIAISNVKFPAFALSNYKMEFYPVPWTTSDGTFNAKYSISAVNDMEIAKLMQPRNVLWFEKLFEETPKEEQVIKRSRKNGYFRNEHSIPTTSELIVATSFPSMYWGTNINLFKRSWNKKKKLKTDHDLADSLASVELKGFETLMNNIHPLLEKAI